MVIEIPGYEDLRISGDNLDWQVQTVAKGGKSAGEWRASNYFPSLEHAIAFVYEKVLRDMDKKLGYTEVPDACRKVKNELVKAVKKAVSEC